MRTFDALRQRLPAWADWIVLALMSVAAPVIAGCIHSLDVILRGFRLYNAEIGGAYFHNSGWEEQSIAITFLRFVSFCVIPAVPTFAVLLIFRKRPQLCRAVWVGIVALWIWFYFSMEVSIH